MFSSLLPCIHFRCTVLKPIIILFMLCFFVCFYYAPAPPLSGFVIQMVIFCYFQVMKYEDLKEHGNEGAVKVWTLLYW